jgi:hypothetical protein
MASACSSDSAAKWLVPEMLMWVSQPPRVSASTTSPVTALMTSGPVRNM